MNLMHKGRYVYDVPKEYCQWLMKQESPPSGKLGEAIAARAGIKQPDKWKPKEPEEVIGEYLGFFDGLE